MAKKVSAKTEELLNLKEFDEKHGILTNDGFRLIYLIVSPYNVPVLGSAAVLTKIRNLQNVLVAVGGMEFLCLGSVQSYDENKQFLARRMEEEISRPIIQNLCQQDIDFFNEISVTMSTNREFLFEFRYRNEKPEQIEQNLSQSLLIIREQGFTVRIASKEDLKKTLAVYWEQNVYTSVFPDIDGGQYIESE